MDNLRSVIVLRDERSKRREARLDAEMKLKSDLVGRCSSELLTNSSCMAWGPINVAAMDLQLKVQAPPLGSSEIGAVKDKHTNPKAHPEL